MLEMFLKMQNKRRAKGGFTLVELIVVLVILAILAALLIPALTGYIDRAKEKSVIAETRQAVMAAQTLADEAYAKVAAKGSITKPTESDIASLAELDASKISNVKCDGSKIETLTYTDKGKACTYNLKATGDKYSVADAK